MTWNEVKMDGYDFCIQSDYWQVRRKGEQVGLWNVYPNGQKFRIGWCKDTEEGMFDAWNLELKRRSRNG